MVVIKGGGVFGLSLALALSGEEKVKIYEKEDEVGGIVRFLDCKATGDKCNRCNACLLDDLIEEVKKNENIEIITGCEFEGEDVIDATGYQLVSPLESEDVITALDFEKAKGEVEGRKIAFLMCAGSRDEHYQERCSRVCCTYVLREANKLLDSDPEKKIAIFYMDIRSDQLDVYDRLKADERVRFIRSRIPYQEIEQLEKGVRVKYEDEGGIKEEKFDKIVLAPGITGKDQVFDITETMKSGFALAYDLLGKKEIKLPIKEGERQVLAGGKHEIETEKGEGKGVVYLLDDRSSSFETREKVKGAIEARNEGVDVSVLYPKKGLNLKGEEELYKEAQSMGVKFFMYGDLNLSEDRVSFRDILSGRELELEYGSMIPPSGEAEKRESFARDLGLLTPRKNVFLVGGDLSTDEQERDAKAALIMPIDEPLYKAKVDKDKCALCLTCVRLCPHDCIDIDYGEEAAHVREQGCFGCGICYSNCPARAIEFVEEELFSTYACENAFPRADPGVKLIPCSGSMDEATLLRSVLRFGSVKLIACYNENCKNYDGDERALLTVESTRRILGEMGYNKDLVEFVRKSKREVNHDSG